MPYVNNGGGPSHYSDRGSEKASKSRCGIGRSRGR